MLVNKSIDIFIQDGQFTVVPCQGQRDATACLETLRRIEDVISRNLGYADGVVDEYSALSKYDLWNRLREEAVAIADSVPQQFSQRSRLERVMSYLDGSDNVGITLITRINNLVHPPRSLPIPDPVTRLTIGFLEVSDIASFAAVNRNGREQASRALVRRAQVYGYKGSATAEAITYLQRLFTSMRTLHGDGLFSKSDAVYRPSSSFFRDPK